jgi:hypothetical protein
MPVNAPAVHRDINGCDRHHMADGEKRPRATSRFSSSMADAPGARHAAGQLGGAAGARPARRPATRCTQVPPAPPGPRRAPNFEFPPSAEVRAAAQGPIQPAFGHHDRAHPTVRRYATARVASKFSWVEEQACGRCRGAAHQGVQKHQDTLQVLAGPLAPGHQPLKTCVPTKASGSACKQARAEGSRAKAGGCFDAGAADWREAPGKPLAKSAARASWSGGAHAASRYRPRRATARPGARTRRWLSTGEMWRPRRLRQSYTVRATRRKKM